MTDALAAKLQEELSKLSDPTFFFNMWDSDKSGAVDKQEFFDTLVCLNVVDKAERSQSDALFDSLDVDGSGSLDYNEMYQTKATWFDETNVLEMLKGLDGESSIVDFASAVSVLVGVLDVIHGLSMMRFEMSDLATKVAFHAHKNAGTTIQELLDAECEGKSLHERKAIADNKNSEKSFSGGMLWLTRYIHFIIMLFDELINDRTKIFTHCILGAYESSLKPHHGFIIKATWATAAKAVQNREKFMMRLGPSEDAVLARIGVEMDALKAVVKNLQDMLAKYFTVGSVHM